MTSNARPYQVRLLGVAQIDTAATVIALGPAQRRAVFAALALRAGHVVPRDELIAAVWGDDPPNGATGSVYTHMSALRRVLRPLRSGASGDVLSASRAGYCLDVPPEQIDVFQFAELCEQARRCERAEDLLGERAALRAALELWRGEPLAGIPGPSAAAHRARLTETWLITMERNADVAIANGEHEQVAAELAALVREHPLRENLHRSLMLALWHCGRQADALRTFDEASEAIADAAGIEPGPPLISLYDKIKAGESPPSGAGGDAVPRRQVKAPQLPARAEPLVGRQQAVGRVHAGLSSLHDGRGATLLVEGDPGIGKTALLMEAVVAADDVTVLWSATDELSRTTSLSVVRFAADGDAAPTVDGLNELDRCVRVVRSLAEWCPVLIVADDLQWARDPVVRVLRDLCQLTEELPLLLVVAARPHPRSDQFGLACGELCAGTGPLRLPPLTSAEVLTLAEELLAYLPGDGVLDLVYRHSAGNPAYVREMFCAYEEGRDIATGDANERFPRLVEVISGHLASLTAPALRMLSTASLLGDSFSREVLSLAEDRRQAELADAIDEASAAGVLEDIDGHLRFLVPVVRAAISAKTPPGIRAMLHEELAVTFARGGASAHAVGKQLLQAPSALAKEWVPEWLLRVATELTEQAPAMAAELLRQVARQPCVTDDQRASMLAVLARLLLPDGPDETGPPAQSQHADDGAQEHSGCQ